MSEFLRALALVAECRLLMERHCYNMAVLIAIAKAHPQSCDMRRLMCHFYAEKRHELPVKPVQRAHIGRAGLYPRDRFSDERQAQYRAADSRKRFREVQR